MNLNKHIKTLAIAIGFISTAAFAEDATVVMPNCLEQAMTVKHAVTAYSKKLALVSLDENKLDQLALDAHKTHCGGFINVSHKKTAQLNPGHFLQEFHQSTLNKLQKKNYKISHQDKVENLIKEVEPKNIWHTLEGLTSFDDRFSRGDNGRYAAFWIKNQFESLVSDAKRDDVETFILETGGRYKQPSVVTLVGKDLKGPAVVLGAHMDTLEYMKPGADDDGSGTSSLMEAARVILNAEKLDSPVYFIWYSAEEMGLVGSQRVVEHFLAKKIKVKSVVQFDMTGYRYHGEEKMWVLRDNVDLDLSNYLESLIKTYIGVDVGRLECGYACSDHASWNKEGFSAAAPFESDFYHMNPYIHTGNDTMEHVSLAHMANYAKLAVAFAVELASK